MDRDSSRQLLAEVARDIEMKQFDYSLDFKTIDFRQQPELYRVGRGEQGVLMVEPYKGEILPHWRFKTVAEAKKSTTNKNSHERCQLS